ncbi:hypothetical protein [Ruminococcus albus]|uniref:hypothetical protein n=1 Tax=Ruminococcus albus TaxID=1264 RepID=UPI00046536F2|nr:hypothetical protein [Ruminococcus albus]
MALYDRKIEQYSKKVSQLEINIRRDTDEHKRLLSEIARLRYLSLCEKLNCEGEKLESVLSREHEQIQRMKQCGMTDEDIDALGSGDKDETEQIRFYSQEEDNEDKNI